MRGLTPRQAFILDVEGRHSNTYIDGPSHGVEQSECEQLVVQGRMKLEETKHVFRYTLTRLGKLALSLYRAGIR